MSHAPIRHDAASQQGHRKHRHGFARSHATLGALHAVTMLATILATDKMKDPQARWAAIAGIGIASGVGESIWRDYVRDRERDEPEPKPRRWRDDIAGVDARRKDGLGAAKAAIKLPGR